VGGADGTAGTGGTAMGGNDGSVAGRDGGAGDGAVDAAPVLTCGPYADGGMPPVAPDGGVAPSPTTSFFVSSQKNMTGNLGGLAGADTRCQTLAAAVGLGAKTWHAYLSVEHDATNNNNPTNARDRIGTGPWFNAKGVMVALDVTALHARKGDPALFIDEHSNMINGNWTGSPQMNPANMMATEHDILTGSNADGTVAFTKTCADWTSTMQMPDGGVPDGGLPDGGQLFVARIGHSDGFGQNCGTAVVPPNDNTSWNSAHDNAGCDNTAPRGGAGRIYCFAVTP
jgi:hypothetical protein